MSDLNDFLALMASAKKTDPIAQKTEKIKEGARQSLGDLFGQLAEAKKQDPKQQMIEKVKDNVKNDLDNLFAQLENVDSPVTITEEAKDHIDNLIEVVQAIESEEIKEEVLVEVADEEPKTYVEKYAASLPKESTSFQQPEVAKVSPELKTITDKLKFLEQWVGKISAAGPGSGEVNLRWLDDVDRSTIGDDKYLRYNNTKKKFEFVTLSGGGVPQVQSDWNQLDDTEPSFIKNKPELFSGNYDDLINKPTLFSGSYNDLTDSPTALSQFTNDLSSVSWTNPSPNPNDNFKTILGGYDGYASITILEGVPGIGSIYTWGFDTTKLTFPDATQQTTAWTGTYSYNDLTDKPTIPAAQIQSDWNQTNDTALDYIKNKPIIPDITHIDDVLSAAGEPMGHEDKTQSAISFNSTTRTFTIAPVGSYFEVWVKGTKHTFTTAQSVTIPNTTNIYYIYFDENGIGYQTSFFTWDQQAPTALIYYNAVTGLAPYFADERHGITLDWQTHEYLHRTRGAVIANGFAIGNYTIGGAVQVDIGDGTFFDEDLQIDVTHSNTPTVNTWEQDLQGPAQIPMFYLSGTGWVCDNPTGYVNKAGSSRPAYNQLSGGVWSTVDIDSNKYGTTFIVATNNLTYPIIAIMSQSAHANQGDAEALEFSDLILTDFPVAEFRLLYKVVFKANSGTHGTLTSVFDLRQLSATTPSAAIGSDHGLLSGLGDDDHPQYLLRTDAASTYATSSDVTDAIANLIGAAPSALDTLKEIADQLAADESVVSSLTATVAGKVSLTGSYANPTWITSLAYSKLTGAPTIPTVPTTVSSFTNDSGYLSSVSWSQVTGKPDAILTLNDTNVVSNAMLVNKSITIGSTAVELGASITTLTGLTGVTSNAATAFIAGAAAESGVALQMPREGALRNMTNGANTMYFDVSNGGTTHGNFNFRSSNAFTSLLHLGITKAEFNPGMEVKAQTPYVGRTPFNSALDTVVTVDNIKYRISNQGGVFPQIASASGSQVDVCYDVLGVVNGVGTANAENPGYLLAANGTWLSIYSTHGMDARGDRLTAHITDKNAGKIYRATFMKTNNSSNTDGFNIIVERVL